MLPLLVFMVAGSFEPQPPKVRTFGAKPAPENSQTAPDIARPSWPVEPVQITDEADNWFGLRYEHYPYVYTVKIALTLATMLFVLPGYRQFPFRISPLAVVVGLIGVALWIGFSRLALEQRLVEAVGKKNLLITLLGLGERSAYNPLDQLKDQPTWAYTFLAIRFFGLALVVPIIEEFFLRGFLMRYVMSDRWWEVPFGEASRLAIAVGIAFPVMYHPEKLAALVWFSLVTWLMVRTRNIWDCVAAHAVTNLLLGIYVVTQGQWRLW